MTVSDTAQLQAQASAEVADPARRPDVLLRRRHDADHEASPWWFIGAFVVVTGIVISALSLIPA
ncbi:MAG: UDP-N-acetylmuramyl pentapeptide phosphotransferase [Microbacterium sp.]